MFVPPVKETKNYRRNTIKHESYPELLIKKQVSP